MLFFLAAGLPRHRPRPARPRPLQPGRRRPRHGPLRRRPGGADRAPRPAATRSTSATRPAAARWPATSRATAESRVAKAVLISAVPPLMVQTDGQSGRPAQGGVRRLAGAAGRQPRRSSTATSPRPVLRLQPARREAVRGVIQNWWRQGMMGGAKAHYDGIVAFSQTDFTEDLKKITVPTLVMHGDDDQVVPLRRLRAAVGQAAAERHAEDLQGLPARHADDPGRHHQRRPPRVHPAAGGQPETRAGAGVKESRSVLADSGGRIVLRSPLGS